MSRARIAAIVLAALITPAFAWCADLTGSWVVVGSLGPKYPFTLVCAFKADPAKLSGPCVGAFGPVLKVGGSQDSRGMKFSYLSDYQGNDFVTEYAGRMNANGSVGGTIEAGMTPGAFSGAMIGNWPDDHLAFWLLDSRLSNGVNWSLGCAFKTSGSTVKGPCAVSVGPPAQADGAIDGAKVTFAYDYAVSGRMAHIVYAGTLQPDGSVKGAVTQDGLSGEFVAKRR